MQELKKLIAQYLTKWLCDFESIVIQKHHIMDSWLVLHISITEERTAKLLISSSGVFQVDGCLNYQVIEIINAINYICNSEYYEIVNRHMKVDVEDARMRLEELKKND